MSLKNKMLVFGLRSTSDDWPSDQSNKSWLKCKKKKTLSHQEMECSVLDYVQLLMMGRVIWMTNVDQNTKSEKRPPMSMKNKMFVYGWHSTFDDQLSNKRWLKCKKKKKKKTNKRPPMSSKIKCSFLDYVQLLMISQVIWVTNVDQNAKKMKKDPLCHWKIRCSLLDYVQLLMIGRVIWASNIDWKAKKNERRPPISLKNKMLSFGLHSTSDDQPCNPSNKSRLKYGKRPPKWLKNEILTFILHSTSDDRPSDPSDESLSKCEKMTCFSYGLLLFQSRSPVCLPRSPWMAR